MNKKRGKLTAEIIGNAIAFILWLIFFGIIWILVISILLLPIPLNLITKFSFIIALVIILLIKRPFWLRRLFGKLSRQKHKYKHKEKSYIWILAIVVVFLVMFFANLDPAANFKAFYENKFFQNQSIEQYEEEQGSDYMTGLEMFNSLNCGMNKQDIIALLGEPQFTYINNTIFSYPINLKGSEGDYIYTYEIKIKFIDSNVIDSYMFLAPEYTIKETECILLNE